MSSSSSSFVAWIWPLSNSSIEGKFDIVDVCPRKKSKSCQTSRSISFNPYFLYLSTQGPVYTDSRKTHEETGQNQMRNFPRLYRCYRNSDRLGKPPVARKLSNICMTTRRRLYMG